MTGDPDLDQAIDDLQFVAVRFDQLNDQLIRHDPVKDYQMFAAKLAERGDCADQIRVRAEKLSLHPRALLLVIQEASRLRRGKRRKPSVAQVRAAIEQFQQYAERDSVEAAADLAAAKHRDVAARHRVNSANAVLQYMDASR
jgi:hypothetical protein